jgi:hypothetical protein
MISDEEGPETYPDSLAVCHLGAYDPATESISSNKQWGLNSYIPTPVVDHRYNRGAVRLISVRSSGPERTASNYRRAETVASDDL